MSDADELDRLCALAGVTASYRDAWGQERHVSSESLRAVLSALTIPARTPHDIAESIAALEAEAWRPLVANAIVARGGDEASSVSIVLPERLAAGRIVWSVACEDGSAHDGASDADMLDVLETKDAGHEPHTRRALPLTHLPLGYHRLTVAAGHEIAEATLIVVPRRCYVPDALGKPRWGFSTQLYSLRSARNWGMGDYADLGAFAEVAAAQGAMVVGINPLHALFPAIPRHASPYSGSSRLYLNPLYLDVTAIPDFAECADAQALVASDPYLRGIALAREAEMIDHIAVSALKWPIFERLYRHFAARNLGPAESDRGAAFRLFQRAGGRPLRDFAIFHALHAHMVAKSGLWSWRDWPIPLQNARGEAVQRFAAEREPEIELHQYLEWEGNRQLEAAARRADAAGLALGFYGDLAVSVDCASAAAWADPTLITTDATVGAPPDILNGKGQDWGLAPAKPGAWRRRSYTPFIAAVRAGMRHAGMLRIDHAMALQQLYWIPRGFPATEGAFVRYPLDDLLGIIALESVRNRCAVIGENLGTVPAGFVEHLSDAGMLSYSVLIFERSKDGAFLPPSRYPRLAVATFSTHDITTLHGFWMGRDLEWRRELNLYPNEEAAEAEAAGRCADRRRLIEALLVGGFLTPEAAHRLLPRDEAPEFSFDLAEAVYRFLGATRSVLALLQIEDALGEIEQANIPGTVDAHPNWRRKLARTIEALPTDGGFLRTVAALRQKRGA